MKPLSRLAIAACLLVGNVHAETITPPPNTPLAVKASPKANTGETSRKPNYVTSKDAAPGGSQSLVWANSHTKRYHCFGAKYYGRTYDGAYVDETEAIEDGYRPSNGTGCSK